MNCKDNGEVYFGGFENRKWRNVVTIIENIKLNINNFQLTRKIPNA